MNKLKTFFRITGPMWVVFLINQIAFTFFADYFYYHLLWVDVPLHIVGGFVASWTAYLFLQHIKAEVRPVWLKFALLIGFACLAAILWEVYEFYHDLLFLDYVYQSSVLDIIADLGDGLIGSVLFCVGVWWKRRRLTQT